LNKFGQENLNLNQNLYTGYKLGIIPVFAY
jgi:hypothetical protein